MDFFKRPLASVRTYEPPHGDSSLQVPLEASLADRLGHIRDRFDKSMDLVIHEISVCGISCAVLMCEGLVSTGTFSEILARPLTALTMESPTPEKIHEFLSGYYSGEKFVKVMPFGKEAEYNGFLAGNACAGWDGIEIFVTGNEDRVLVSTRFDNLGKGASGAAIQCLNIMLGCEEDKGLNL